MVALLEARLGVGERSATGFSDRLDLQWRQNKCCMPVRMELPLLRKRARWEAMAHEQAQVRSARRQPHNRTWVIRGATVDEVSTIFIDGWALARVI